MEVPSILVLELALGCVVEEGKSHLVGVASDRLDFDVEVEVGTGLWAAVGSTMDRQLVGRTTWQLNRIGAVVSIIVSFKSGTDSRPKAKQQ